MVADVDEIADDSGLIPRANIVFIDKVEAGFNQRSDSQEQRLQGIEIGRECALQPSQGGSSGLGIAGLGKR